MGLLKISGSSRVVIGWRDRPFLCFDLVVPPVPLASNTAEHIHAGLFQHPATKPIYDAVRELRRTAERRIQSHEVDGATPNDRLHAHVTTQETDTSFEIGHCANHSQHLATVSLTTFFDMKLPSEMYTASAFLSYNGHFARLQNVVKLFVRRCFEIAVLLKLSPTAVRFQNFNITYVEFLPRHLT
jgi:hypothetical protein